MYTYLKVVFMVYIDIVYFFLFCDLRFIIFFKLDKWGVKVRIGYEIVVVVECGLG